MSEPSPAAGSAPAVEPPRVFRWPPAGVAAARARVRSGEIAADARELAATDREARKAMAEGPFSVVDKTTVPPSGDKHDYWSIAAYWWPDPDKEDGIPYIRRDGRHNPAWKTEIADSWRLKQMATAAERLALGSYLLDREEYAERATRLLRVWFLDPDTRMNPHLTYAQAVPGRADGRSVGIIDSLFLTHAVDAIGLLATSTAWTAADQRAVENWFSTFLEWLLTSDRGGEERNRLNNHGTYIDVQIVSYALFLGQLDVARRVLEQAKTARIERAIEPDGSQPAELARTRTFKYCTYNLKGVFELAMMGEQAGVDLWHHETADGRSIRAALGFVAPFLDEGREWPYEEISSQTKSRRDLALMLRRAAIAYGDDGYEQLVREHAGPKALNHAQRLFYPAPERS